MFRSVLYLFSGNSFFSLMGLLRNLLVARLLDIEDYGIAATFAVSLAIVEMLSNLGLKKMIVQDRQGDDPNMQATLQGFQLLRATAAAVALFLLAHPLAAFLGIPHVAWAYQVMALVPFLNGFRNLDLQRMHRRMHFLPSILGTSGPALASVLLIWPFFLLLGDYRVMLYAILAQIAFGVVSSHLLAKRRFRLAFDYEIVRRSLRFGWPILMNGALLFAVLHGEKLVVGRELGMGQLAIFAMGFTLSLTPLGVVSKSLNQFFLPQLSTAQDDSARFNRLSRINFQAHFLCAVLFAALLAIYGPAIVHLLLGEKFAALSPLLAWLGILNALRLFKAASALSAFALGRTGNALWGNLPRAVGLPLAWYVLVTGGDLLSVIWVGLLGEAAGFLLSLMLLRKQSVFHLRPLLPTLLLNVAVLAILAMQAGLPLLFAVPEWATLVLRVSGLALFAASLFVAKDLWAYVALVGRRRR